MHYLFLLFITLDQITKAFFAGRDFFVLSFHLHPVKNFGLPFGLNFGSTANVILLFAIYFLVGWFVIQIKNQSKWTYICRSLFLAGAASNLTDRLVYGYVRDFIDIRLGFVFNLADLFIVLGLVFLLIRKTEIQKVENPSITGKT